MTPPPRLIFWELTKRCNLRCQHCRAVPESKAVPGELDSSQARQFLSDLSEFAKPLLIFTGGEPLTRPDLFDIGGHAHDLGFRTALATNGTILSENVAIKIREAHFERVAISLDGSKSETHDTFRRQAGAYDRAILGAKNLLRLGIPLQINTTATQHNVSEIPAIFDIARSLGAIAFHLFLLVPVGCGLEITKDEQLKAEQYEDLLGWLLDKELEGGIEIRATCAPHYYRLKTERGVPVRGKGCLAGTGVCFVGHRGDVQGCGYLPLVAGNILKKPFSEIWEESTLFQHLRNPTLLLGRCKRCTFQSICSGCRARAYGQYGNYLQEEPFCTYQPALV